MRILQVIDYLITDIFPVIIISMSAVGWILFICDMLKGKKNGGLKQD